MMVSITLSVPEDVKKEMDQFHEINWSAVAREAIKKKLHLLEKFKQFTSNSTFTEADTLSFGKEISLKAMKRHRA